MRKLTTLVICVTVALIGQACDNGGLKITVNYPDDPGIVSGDRVLEQNEVVGVVTDVATDGKGAQVKVAIKPESAKDLTDRTRFYVDVDPEKADHKAILLVRSSRSGTPLSDGAVVEGSDKSLEMLHRFQESLEAGAQEMINQFKGFMEDIEKTPESDAVQQLKKDLEALAQVFQESAKSAQETIQREVLPELEKQLEELQRKLRELGREQEITELKHELDQMQKM